MLLQCNVYFFFCAFKSLGVLLHEVIFFPTAELSSITDSNTLKAVVKSLAPALLAELAKKKSVSSTSSSKGSSSSSWKRPSPPKRTEYSKSSRTSVTKTPSTPKVHLHTAVTCSCKCAFSFITLALRSLYCRICCRVIRKHFKKKR